MRTQYCRIHAFELFSYRPRLDLLLTTERRLLCHDLCKKCQREEEER